MTGEGVGGVRAGWRHPQNWNFRGKIEQFLVFDIQFILFKYRNLIIKPTKLYLRYHPLICDWLKYASIGYQILYALIAQQIVVCIHLKWNKKYCAMLHTALGLSTPRLPSSILKPKISQLDSRPMNAVCRATRYPSPRAQLIINIKFTICEIYIFSEK